MLTGRRLRMKKKHCVDTMTLHNAYGVSDVVIDFLVILLPIPWVRQSRVELGTESGFLLTGSLRATDFAITNVHQEQDRGDLRIRSWRLVSKPNPSRAIDRPY